MEHLRDVYTQDRVANVITFAVEKAKAAIQTAARGLGIDVDEARYLSSLVPEERGQTWTLQECFYGNKELGRKPVSSFVREMTDNYPEVWEVAQSIEGIVCRSGIHAGGVIFVDEPFTNSAGLMRAPDGTVVTAFDLHDSEAMSLIKYDLLSVEALDKIHYCLDLLVKDNMIEDKGNLRNTYESVIGIYNLEREDRKLWELINKHQIQSLFQLEKQSGIQGIAIAKPQSVNDLAVLNSVIRLMAPEKGGEQPLQMWARYRKDITQWYDEMRQFGLNEDEIKWLANHRAITNGIAESQESLMELVQEDRLGGNSLTFADKCRKAIAKKQGKLFEECEEEFFKTINEKGCSKKLADYVWNILLRIQRGYSFNRSHTLAYSLIALQEANFVYKFPSIYWNTACLIANSGTEGGNTDYAKIAKAVCEIQASGVNISLPDINASIFEFSPDVKNNTIRYGFKAMLGVGDELIQNIVNGRPYVSIKDFYNRIHPDKTAMISLIKGGVFDNLMDRKTAMGWYIWETCDKKSNLTLQNIAILKKFDMLPKESPQDLMAARVYEFNRYLKQCCKIDSTKYKLDDRAIQFLCELGYDDLVKGDFILEAKIWDKYYQSWMDTFRNWIKADKENILNELNKRIFKEKWQTDIKTDNYSAWEMDALCFYYHEHELKNIDFIRYGISHFNKLPEEPVIDKVFKRGNNEIKIFKLTNICGTAIAKNKTKGVVTMLTPDGVVNVRFRKDYFNIFDKQISQKNPDGTKKIVEKSWFNKGNMLLIHGMRQGNEFVAKKYNSESCHTLYHIDSIDKNGEIVLRTERAQGEESEDV